MTVAVKAAHVLVVDDEPLTAAGLTQYLNLQGYTARTANSVREALASVEHQTPDIILLDLVMPEETGISLLQELRQDPEYQSLPVIVTSALKDTDDIVGALRAGANDYITKPVDLPILLARIERHLALAEAMTGLERQTDIQWQMGSSFDETSGACGRKHLLETLEGEIHRSGRHGTDLSILILDIDNFQTIASERGPVAADSLLRQFVESMSGALRRSDKLCRVDAHSFCAILPQTDEPGALKAAEQIRQWLENIAFSIESHDVTTTVSIGAAALKGAGENRAEELLDQALNAMREAKRQGNNRVFVSNPAGVPFPADASSRPVQA